MNLPFDLGFPLAGTLRERLRLAHKARALSEVKTRCSTHSTQHPLQSAPLH